MPCTQWEQARRAGFAPARFTLKRMNKLDLANSLAKKSHSSKAKAADDVDSLVHRLIKDLKQTQKRAKEGPSSAMGAPFPRPLRES